jgi:hypothetical protein
MFYFTGRVYVPGDTTATVNNIQAAETMVRVAIASGLVSNAVFVLLAITLYKLFEDVSSAYASALVALVVVAASVASLNYLSQLAALSLLGESASLATFEPDQVNALVLWLLEIHAGGIHLVTLFWGLWLFPLGVLTYRSGFIPRSLGALLVVGSVGYVLNVLVLLVVPTVESIAVVGPLLAIVVALGPVIATLGEFSMMAWLVLKGAQTRRPATETVS